MAKALTAVSVEKLKPEAARREVPDARDAWVVSRHPAVRIEVLGRALPSRRQAEEIDRRRVSNLRPRGSAQESQRSAAGSCQRLRPARQKKAAKTAAYLNNQDVFPAVARLFIARHARPNNKSWKEAARLLGLRPHPEQPDELLHIKGGLVERWNDRPVRDLGKRDVVEAIDNPMDGGTGTLANRTPS